MVTKWALTCTIYIPNKIDIDMVVEKEVTSTLHSEWRMAFIRITCTNNDVDLQNHTFPQN